MQPALNLAALALTLSGFLNDRKVILKEENGDLSFDLLEVWQRFARKWATSLLYLLPIEKQLEVSVYEHYLLVCVPPHSGEPSVL
jgi:hypothetical protein